MEVRREASDLIFIDASLAYLPNLLASVEPTVDVELLSPNEDGLEQIAAAVSRRRGIRSIAIVCHGAPGKIRVGASLVDEVALHGKHDLLGRIRSGLNHQPELRLYSCRTASTVEGQRFVSTFADAIGAVAAGSSRNVGNAKYGANWQLDRATGVLTTRSPLNANIENYPSCLNISYAPNAPTTPQVSFGFYENPYTVTFLDGGYYQPYTSGNVATWLLTQQLTNSPDIFLAVYEGDPGNAILKEYDYGPTPPASIVQTDPNDWGGSQGEHFFAVAFGYNNFNDVLNLNNFLTGAGVDPDLPYSIVSFDWGVAPSNQPPVIDQTHSILNGTVKEMPNATGSSATDAAVNGTGMPGGVIAFSDPDTGDRPTASIDTTHESLVYHGSNGQTYSLAPAQIAVIESGLSITPAASNTNLGDINWTYHITDSALDFLGAGESITLTAPVIIDDHNGGTAPADITITIDGANDSPVANPVAVNVEDGFTALSNAASGVLSHDSDPDIHDTLYIGAVNGSATNVGRSIAGKYGTLTLNADGSYSYNENFFGQLLSRFNISLLDTFSYTVSDGHGGTATSTLTFNTREAPAPIASPDIATVAQGGTVAHPSSTGVLSNDKDPDGDPLTVSGVSFGNQQVAITSSQAGVITGRYGTLTLKSDGSYSYTETSPNIPARGVQDAFTYTVSNGHGGTATSTLSISVSAVSLTPTYAARQGMAPITDYYDYKGGHLIAENIGGDLNWRNNNPGNITSGMEDNLAIGFYHINGLTYDIFPDYNTGVLAAVQLLESSLYAGANLSIEQAMQEWTNDPPGSLQLKNYDLQVEHALGLPGSTLVKKLSPAQLDILVTQGIQVAEGGKPGTHLTFRTA
jgi:VCBS repeat-containing protein